MVINFQTIAPEIHFGRFAGATGNLKLLFGATDFADLKNGNAQFIFRYQGQICFAGPGH
jgi:hypothetical protein